MIIFCNSRYILLKEVQRYKHITNKTTLKKLIYADSHSQRDNQPEITDNIKALGFVRGHFYALFVLNSGSLQDNKKQPTRDCFRQ